MSFLEWLLLILSLISGLCYVIASFVFLFLKRMSRKKYRWFIFVSVFLFVFFSFLIPFFRKVWGSATISEYIFFIVLILIISLIAGGFMALGDLYNEKFASFSQSRLKKVMQKQAARVEERKEEDEKGEEK